MQHFTENHCLTQWLSVTVTSHDESWHSTLCSDENVDFIIELHNQSFYDNILNVISLWDTMRIGLCSTSDIITFDQNWHHVHSSSAGGKDISNDTQIRVTGLVEPTCEICTKMLRNISEIRGAKFPVKILSYPMVKITHLDCTFPVRNF